MPNIKSAIKRVKTAERNRVHNTAAKSFMKTATKKALIALGKTNPETGSVTVDVQKAISLIDRLAAKGIIHKRQAARRKSRLMGKAAALTAATAAATPTTETAAASAS